ncbi:hypothetical protein [Nonomuraea sp. NPDC049158]|uniref:hypothetical protein n=1 Tax=Nonomuraea sp. NPDC049158 TaxID=3155649 RepID=UPI0033C53E1C
MAGQLSVLRSTYPGWDIDFERDSSGQLWWTAELRKAVTLEMVATGVVQCVRQPDAIALAASSGAVIVQASAGRPNTSGGAQSPGWPRPTLCRPARPRP